jgi:hypothetical protein
MKESVEQAVDRQRRARGVLLGVFRDLEMEVELIPTKGLTDFQRRALVVERRRSASASPFCTGRASTNDLRELRRLVAALPVFRPAHRGARDDGRLVPIRQRGQAAVRSSPRATARSTSKSTTKASYGNGDLGQWREQSW